MSPSNQFEANYDNALTYSTKKQFLLGLAFVVGMSVFPVMHIWYPSAWFMAGATLVFLTFVNLVGVASTNTLRKTTKAASDKVRKERAEAVIKVRGTGFKWFLNQLWTPVLWTPAIIAMATNWPVLGAMAVMAGVALAYQSNAFAIECKSYL